MDFLSSQDKARRNTFRLVLLFSAAVVGLIVLTNLVVAAGFVFAENFNSTVVAVDLKQRFLDQLTPVRLGMISAVVVSVVVLASIYKLVVLSSGGRAIAEMLGARLVPSMTQDRLERRLINVVEEMAIASGTPVPPVYLMEDEAINARLRELIKRDSDYPRRFCYSVLQVLPKTMARGEVFKREQLYKEKLGTRAQGLNVT